MIVQMVNMLYKNFAIFDDHAMGRHTPPTVYIRKFNRSNCILVIMNGSLRREHFAQKRSVAQCTKHLQEDFEKKEDI